MRPGKGEEAWRLGARKHGETSVRKQKEARVNRTSVLDLRTWDEKEKYDGVCRTRNSNDCSLPPNGPDPG